MSRYSAPHLLFSVVTVLLAFFGAGMAWSPPASAQIILGDFGYFNSPWVHPTTSSKGVRYEPSSDEIEIDRDGDGLSAEAHFPAAQVWSSQVPDPADLSFFLSPSRSISMPARTTW